jgi:hypothetical protein
MQKMKTLFLISVVSAIHLPLVSGQNVWNVNVGNSTAGSGGASEITTGDNYLGAAPENTANSTWNAVTTAAVATLADSTGSSAAGVTFTVSPTAGVVTYGGQNITGDEIFDTWIKDDNNLDPFTVTFGNLPALGSGESYSLVIYSDWWWKNGNGGQAISQTSGTGLAGSFILNRYIGGTPAAPAAVPFGTVTALAEDTNPADVNGQTNFVRFNGLTPDGSNNLSFSMGDVNGPINGFQLIKVGTDDTPPTPDPMTFASAPAPAGESSITMTATTASDTGGVEYFFDETSGNPGGSDSVWQDSPIYTDTGLSPGTSYTYTVTARDKSAANNATAPSAPASASTLAADTAAPTPSPMSFAIAPIAASNNQVTMTATAASDVSGVEYFFTETSGNPGGDDSGWQDSPVYSDTGLSAGTAYTYTVKARDKSNARNATADSDPASATTLAAGVGLVANVNFDIDINNRTDLVGPAGGAGETWNQTMAGTNGGPAFSNSTAVVDSTGAATSIGWNLTINNSAPLFRWNGSDVATLSMLKRGIFTNSGANHTLTLTGLNPAAKYDLYIAGYTTGYTNKVSHSTSNTSTTSSPQVMEMVGVPGNSANWNLNDNFIVFTDMEPDPSGTITVNAVKETAYGFWSGFQLLQTTLPTGLITSFGVPGSTGVIDQNSKTITLTVPYGTDLATLAPTFTLNSGTCNQTSGAPPSPTFAVQNPVNYVVTDTSTDPDTVNTYSVKVVNSLVIDLGTSPSGTTIPGVTFIGSGPTNLPIPALPPGSVLRSIVMNTVLEATTNDNFASDLSLLLDPTPETPGVDFSVEITNGITPFGAALSLEWPGSAEVGPVTPLADTKTDADFGVIDLSSTGLFLGNAYGSAAAGGTWSGTITLAFDTVPSGSPFEIWATGDEPFEGDANGDGVIDGMAFLLGAANPSENAIGRLPTASEGGGLVLNFSCRDAAGRGPAPLKLQWSSDLGASDPWTSNEAAIPAPPGGTVNGVVFVVTENALDSDIDDVQATIPSGEGPDGKLFGRLFGAEN